jgi:hypothetical protein
MGTYKQGFPIVVSFDEFMQIKNTNRGIMHETTLFIVSS